MSYNSVAVLVMVLMLVGWGYENYWCIGKVSACSASGFFNKLYRHYNNSSGGRAIGVYYG